MRESIRITATPADAAPLPPGSSRLGGLPDLPGGVTWPAWKGVPMSFLAQVRLEDLRDLAPAQALPQKGLLSFFYDAVQETYGADPADRGGWKVFFFPAEDSVGQVFAGRQAGFAQVMAPAGLPEGARFKPCALSFSLEWSLPSAPVEVVPTLSWTEDQVGRYENFCADIPGAQDRRLPHHRMFGWPNQIQDDMQLQCALYANGISAVDDPRVARLIRQKDDWQLLFQLDSDDRAGMRWASYGMLYFWIEQASLQQGQFEKTWLVLQSG